MKRFEINILSDEPEIINGEQSHRGELFIGNFVEEFQIPLTVWRLKDYKKQWHEALERIKTHDSSCFVTFIRREAAPLDLLKDPNDLEVLLWALYKVDTKIIIQKHYFDSHLLQRTRSTYNLPPFSAETCYSYLDQRETIKNANKLAAGKKVAE